MENEKLIRAMFGLLLRQYNGVADVSLGFCPPVHYYDLSAHFSVAYESDAENVRYPRT